MAAVKKTSTYKKQIQLPHALIGLRADSIIEITSVDDFEYDVDAILQNYDAIKELKETPKALVLNIAGKYTTVTNDGRNFVSTAPHKNFVTAEAFVIQSLAQKMLAQFYLKINKPKVPANFFTSAADAVKWLKKFT